MESQEQSIKSKQKANMKKQTELKTDKALQKEIKKYFRAIQQKEARRLALIKYVHKNKWLFRDVVTGKQLAAHVADVLHVDISPEIRGKTKTYPVEYLQIVEVVKALFLTL